MEAKYIDFVLDRQLILDCPRIELKPSAPESGKQQLIGAGTISTEKPGEIQLKVFFEQSFSLEETFESLSWEAGKVIEEDYYYDLVAHDISGNVWQAKRLLPDRSSGPHGSMIFASLHELEHSTAGHPNISGTLVDFYFDELINVPLNTIVREEMLENEKIRLPRSGLNLARFSSCDVSFEIDNSSGKTVFRASSEDPNITDEKISRMYESFCFELAYTKSWSALVVSRAKDKISRLRSVSPEQIRTRVSPPLHISHDLTSQMAWSLFDKYFSYVSHDLKSAHHRLSILSRTVVESGKASLNVQALTLSVSIETLLRDEMKGIYEAPEGLIKNINCASQLIYESGALDASFRKRMQGALGAMKQPRAKDVLAALQQRSLIDGELVKTYDKLRNKMAHGAYETDVDIQNLFNQTSTVLVLFYRNR